MSHLLAPYSIKIFVHVGQIIKTGKVSTFNHAKNIDNILEYGSETPVDIEPKFITHKKMILVRSESDDYLSNKADQEHFINDLTGKFGMLHISLEKMPIRTSLTT